MSLSLGRKLQIRSMIYVAGEPIPFFWTMRTFIHHNPLHALEHLPFDQAIGTGTRLFHGRGFLPREGYQRYLQQGQVDEEALSAQVNAFVTQRQSATNIDLQAWLMHLLTSMPKPVFRSLTLASAADVHAQIHDEPLSTRWEADTDKITEQLSTTLLRDRPVYEAVDSLYGSLIGEEVDELVIKSCLNFFDEGQSVWTMPGRKQGFFAAWRNIVQRNMHLFAHGVHINRILEVDDTPEGIIAHVMESLQVSDKHWTDYFTRELSRLHGWAGFIRWRANARHYYWNERYPADLVDLVAVRLTIALALLQERQHKLRINTASAIEEAIVTRLHETYLRHEMYSGQVLPAMAQRVEQTLMRGRAKEIDQVFRRYTLARREHESREQARTLLQLARSLGDEKSLLALPEEQLSDLLRTLYTFEQREGMIWLKAMEAHTISHILDGVNIQPQPPREKRPFVQALFCIDVRSERFRRHLESVGDYQTFGIAGFFGVPISFMELGKGSENHLCPVLLTPKNLVLEMTVTNQKDVGAVTALDKLLHELKESVLSPFVTVEAIGLLFGFDMVGKTLMPQAYNRWRKHLDEDKPRTHLLLDKITREQADSILRTAQRGVIIKAVEQELGLEAEQITDDMVRQLREAALGKQAGSPELMRIAKLNSEQEQAFIQRLREIYRIDAAFANLQLERIGRIGFSLDEQVTFVSQALQAIGLTKDFSRFILLVGHGSLSDNNPYESALDCGACGGSHGLVNARTLAQMANKTVVRRRLRAQGIDIPDDAWFVPALHNTTTDELQLHDLDLLPSSHIVYIDRLRNGLTAASRLCAQERMPSLRIMPKTDDPTAAYRGAQRNAMDWSQVRPEWGLSRNAYFIIGRRGLTEDISLEGRAFLHSYDYRVDPKRRLLENILTGPLVVGQWINMEHYFSTVDNERFGSGSKVYHNVAGRFGVMTGNLSDLRTGLPSQTVLEKGMPYHQPIRLITILEAPFEHARQAVDDVVTVKNLVLNGWLRLVVIDPERQEVCIYEDGEWNKHNLSSFSDELLQEESGV